MSQSRRQLLRLSAAAVGADPTAAEDNEEQKWVVRSYDAHTGKELWWQTARSAKRRATRHERATHANTTLATDGEEVWRVSRKGICDG